MPVAEAIVQRFVDVKDVALYESLGLCFGRKPGQVEVDTEKVSGVPVRVY
jgi:6-phosphofructokinase 1